MIAPNDPPADSFSKADVERFTEAFGSEVGLDYLRKGTPFVEALEIEFDKLKALMRSREALERSRERQFGYGDSY